MGSEPEGLGEYAEELIRFKARQLAGKRPFRRDDRDDIAQELRLEVLRRLPRFDPVWASRDTFIARVIDHAAALLLEKALAAKRGNGLAQASLQDPVDDGEGGEAQLWQTLAGDGSSRRVGFGGPENPDRLDRRDLRIDLEAALRKLTDEQKRLAELILRLGFDEASRVLGVPRTTLYGHLREIRAILVRAGFGDYLEKPPTDFEAFR